MRIPIPSNASDCFVDQVSTTSLGNHTYVVASGGEAVVIDPPRDVDRIDEFIPVGHRVVAVCETHVHNDYVSGGFWLARDRGVPYIVPGGAGARYEHQPALPGQRIPVGVLWLNVVDTPGHTLHHASFVLAGESGPFAVFTGGSMLVAAVGRSDLLGEDFTDQLLRLQYASVMKLATDLPVDVVVAPTHGAGSFCSASAVSGTTSTIGAERIQNPVCTAESVDEFVAVQRLGYGLYPAYYEHMADLNLSPADRLELSELPTMSADEAIELGCDIVDVRPFDEFAERHIAGSIAAPTSDQDATYIAWTLPWNTPIVIVGMPDAVTEFRTHLARLGWDAVIGVVASTEIAALSDAHVLTNGIATFSDLVDRRPRGIVDVRDPLDHARGTVRGAIPAHVSVVARNGVETDEPQLWVYCGGGYRAIIATGFLERQGYGVTTVVDDAPPDLPLLL